MKGKCAGCGKISYNLKFEMFGELYCKSSCFTERAKNRAIQNTNPNIDNGVDKK